MIVPGKPRVKNSIFHLIKKNAAGTLLILKRMKNAPAACSVTQIY
jgi:hypothetical protein